MATLLQSPPAQTRINYLNVDHGWKSWLFTTDHKRIAILYLISITSFFFVGGFFALLMRLELMTPRNDLVQADTYNKLFTMHGIIMVFFFLIPSIPATLGNFLVPIMIGARDLAFPRINLLSWYIYIIAGYHDAGRHRSGRRRYRMDFLSSIQYDLLEHLCDGDGYRCLHQRILVHPDWSELYRHHP